ncbi:MAG TPA: WhiB family transcriptional regulator [Acidimicrobiia bacterium]
MPDIDWMADAACLGKVDAMWDDSTPSPEALRLCFRCPVQRTCAEYGLARVPASDAGVLGGLGLYDRDKVRDAKRTVQEAWAIRLNLLVASDWDDALSEDFARMMPRLELV